jgi:hypothetical protein
LWPQKISDNLCQKIIEAEPYSLEIMLKVMKTMPKDLSGKKVQLFFELQIIK